MTTFLRNITFPWPRRFRGLLALLASSVMTMGVLSMADELMLYDFSEPVPPELLEMRQTTTRLTEAGALEIVFQPRGTRWPGITLKAPEGKWDLRPYRRIGLDIRNTSAKVARVGFRFDYPRVDSDYHCIGKGRSFWQEEIDIMPGETRRLDISYDNADGKMTVDLFGMQGYPVEINAGMGGVPAVNAGNVSQILVFMDSPQESYSIEIDNIKASGKAVTGAERPGFNNDNFFPFIDSYGQFIHRDWPGKVHGPEDIEAHRVAEEKELAAMPGPADWNKWGGWAAGPQLNATGFFRTEKYADKWWLVDPDGRLFISHGLDCVRCNEGTPIDDRASWFQDFPGDREEFKNCFSTQYLVQYDGYYRGKKPRLFDFNRANIMRKYGEDWQAKARDIAHRRLRSWGLNTIGNWSDANVYLQRRTPYFVNVGTWGVKVLEGGAGHRRRFSDVFDPSFRQALDKSIARERGKSVDDPWCIGYFVGNEPRWGDVTALAEVALLSPPEQPAKIELLKGLQAQYADIQALNAAWETSFASWEAMSANRDEVKLNDAARRDLRVFNRAFIETYFRTVRDALKAGAPNQLYAGCRFVWTTSNADAEDIAGAYCDIVSHNLYRLDVSFYKDAGSRDVPLLIGEFHFGALDRGMFHTGLEPVESQEARAEAYKNYVLGMLRHRNFVGCHWFQYADQPTTGRGADEENYQIGFVDIVDTPYPETIAACREVGYSLYEYRLKAGSGKK
ncbi:MAG: hypothetical protein ACOX9E_16300 [Lentisphaeria bacterium]|jgi:hypothetical protein